MKGSTMLTQRAYLVSLGLAKDGRGKFSNAAKDALAKAIEQGMEFSDPTPAAKPKKVLTTSVKATQTPRIDAKAFDPKAVRKWAEKAGIEIGARGRIHTSIVAKYLSEVGDAAPARTNDLDVYRDTAARVRNADTYSVTVDGEKIVRTYKDVCNSCGYSIGWCYEPNGPFVFADPRTSNLITLSAGE
jgi:hypothetical protein